MLKNRCSGESPESAAGDEGYTLVECLIVLVIASIVSGIAAGLYVFASEWAIRWQSSLAVENGAHLLMTRVVRDLRYADRVFSSGDTAWVIRRRNNPDISYSLADSTIRRNERLMLPEDVRVSGFSIEADSNSSAGNPPAGQKPAGRLMTVEFDLGTARSSLVLVSRIGMRQPEPWSVHAPSFDATSNGH